MPCDCVVQFLRLGFDGYKQIMVNLMEVAAHLAKGILDTGLSVVSTPMSPLCCAENNCLFAAPYKKLLQGLRLLCCCAGLIASLCWLPLNVLDLY